jgi:hypothetical protein
VNSSSSTIIFTVVNIKTFFPASLNHLATIFEVVVFQLVQVIQIIIISLCGKPYIKFAITALIL